MRFATFLLLLAVLLPTTAFAQGSPSRGGIAPVTPSPTSFDITLEAGTSTTETLTLTNNTATPYAFALSTPSWADDETVLVIQNTNAWGLDMAAFLTDDFGLTVDKIGYGDIAATDFSNYSVVFTVGDESTAYYNALSNNVAQFEAYVSAGGVVQYQLATQGPGVSIVGGVTVTYGSDGANAIAAPGHPIVSGLSSPLNGTSASHTWIGNLPGDALVITTTGSTGEATTVEYRYGGGAVVATGMTWEYLARGASANTNQLLSRAVAYSLSLTQEWLSADPEAGSIDAEGNSEITLTFDATELNAGTYEGSVEVIHEGAVAIQIPVTLTVTGAPSLALTPVAIDFGELIAGESAVVDFTVMNDGTDTLRVSSVASSNPAVIAVEDTSFVLPPAFSATLTATFAPVQAGAYAETITVSSNADAAGIIAASGSALPAPRLAMNTRSMEFYVTPDGTSSRMLELYNAGGSVLDYDIAEVPVIARRAAPRTPEVVASRTFTRLAENRYASESAARERTESSLATASTEELVSRHVRYRGGGALPRVLHFKDLVDSNPNHRSVVAEVLATLPLDVTSYGTAFFDDFITAVYDETWDLVIFESGILIWDVAQLIPYVEAGGRLMFSYWDADQEADLVAALGATPETSFSTSQEVVQWIDHPTFLVPNQIDALRNPADLFLDDGDEFAVTTGIALGGFSETEETGRAGIVLGNEGRTILNGFYYGDFSGVDTDGDGTEDIVELIENQIFFFTNSVRWLEVNPEAGSIEPSDGDISLVAVDAAGLTVGTYEALLVISTNNPFKPSDEVAVTLVVADSPNLQATPAALDIFDAYVGFDQTRSFTIRNMGGTDLTVSAITSDDATIMVSDEGFTVAPGQSYVVEITVNPAEAGAFTGALTVVSDDPDTPSTEINIAGTAIEPPALTAEAAISVTVPAGQSTTATTAVENTGASMLRVEAYAVESDEETRRASADARTALPTVWPARGVRPAFSPVRLGTTGSAQARGTVLPLRYADARAEYEVVEAGLRNPDVSAIRASANEEYLALEVDFASGFDAADFGGVIGFDVDQDTTTGAPPIFGQPGQYPGIEVFLDLFGLGFGVVTLVDPSAEEPIATYEASVWSDGFFVSIPLVDLGGSDGRVDLSGVIGNTFAPTDWFPEAGNISTVGPRWLSVPSSMFAVDAAQEVDMEASFDATDLPVGTYGAKIVLASNDPAVRTDTVAVTMDIVTPVSNEGGAVPSTFALHTAYPNPFTSEATIAFDVPAPSDVRVMLYDALGREVAVLADRAMEPGQHTVALRGVGLPAGLYLCRMQAGTFTATTKLLLVH